MNWSGLWAFVKSNPSIILAVGTPIVKAAASDPSLITDAVGLSKGGTVGAFVEKHPAVVSAVASAALEAVTANPQLITEAVAAFSTPAPSGAISASGGGA